MNERIDYDKIKKYIDKAIEKNFQRNLILRIDEMIRTEGRIIILNKIKEINPETVLANRLDELMTMKFEPIINKCIEESIKLTTEKIHKKINKTLKTTINLRTSTIMDIKQQLSKENITPDESGLQELQNMFPEYYDSIKKIEQL